MTRRIILATCLAAVVAGTAGAALAEPPQANKHDICIALAQNDNYHAADYYCITTP